VRDEDLDWLVYRRIADTNGITADDLFACIRQDPAAVEASLKRLERYLLIERTGALIRALSLQESLVLCYCRHARNLPIYVENGVIRVKKNDG